MWYAAVQTAMAGPSIWGQVRAASATNGRTKRAVTLPSSNMTKFQRSSGRGGNFDFAGGETESGCGKGDGGGAVGRGRGTKSNPTAARSMRTPAAATIIKEERIEAALAFSGQGELMDVDSS